MELLIVMLGLPTNLQLVFLTSALAVEPKTKKSVWVGEAGFAVPCFLPYGWML